MSYKNKNKKNLKKGKKMNYKLNEKELKILEMAAEDCDLKIDYEYSGRAMFGE